MTTWTDEASKPVLTVSDRRPRKIRYFVSLYRTDLLFRSLVDLSVVGLLVLAITGNVPDPARWFMEQESSAPVAASNSGRTISGEVIHNAGRTIGVASYDVVNKFQIDEEIIQQSPPKIASALREANTLIREKKYHEARKFLAINGDTATLNYGKGIVLANDANPKESVAVIRYLRDAATDGIREAFTILGQFQFMLSLHYDESPLVQPFPNAVDAADQLYVATPEELRKQAKTSWERAAALGSPAATRFLGFLKAKGIGGPVDVSAAVAFWRDATQNGDAVAPLDLAVIHLMGSNFAGDEDQALDYLELAIERGTWSAGAILGAQLISRAKAGDTDAARRGIEALEKVVAQAIAEGESEGAAISADLLGTMLLHFAPPDMRDPQSAIKYLRFAAERGHVDAALASSELYAAGTYVKKDPVEALRLLAIVKDKSGAPKAKIEDRQRALISQMSEEQKAQFEQKRGAWEVSTRLGASRIQPVPNGSNLAAPIPGVGVVPFQTDMSFKNVPCHGC